MRNEGFGCFVRPGYLLLIRRRITGVLAAIGFLYVAVSVTPLVNWWTAILAGKWDDPKGDTLIVLGGSMLEDGFLGESSYWRSVYAVRAYRSGGCRRMLFSGGPAARPVADAMREFVACSGVPREALTAETLSKNTRENALAIARLLDADRSRKVLLTSDYHMFRAHRSFAKAGLEVQPRPIPDGLKRGSRWMGRWGVFLDLCQESMKIGYYYARGWI
jgi:uncharacterized SAM-binding protein YcdF (DUF218 family)